MINEEKKYELIKFMDGDFVLDVNVSPSEDTVWLTLDEIGALFERDRSVIGKHIKRIYNDKELTKERTWAKNARVLPDGRNYNIAVYNLDMIIAVGYRINPKRIAHFRNWALNTIKELRSKNSIDKPLIVFRNKDISLDVNVDPNEDTVWLSKDQLILLYETTRQNIEYHINNIYAQNELEIESTCKEILHFTKESDRYEYRTIVAYNLDMIISLGYRINSKNGIIFRKWANKILKEYLLSGHVINEERCLACTSNILSLESKYNALEEKMNTLEETIYSDNSKIIYEGEILEPCTFIRKLFFLAKKEIIVVDSYADKFLLDLLKNIKINVTIITSSNSYLNKEIVPNNVHIIHNDAFHDRFIIIDDLVYSLGTSINDIGKKRFVIIKLNDIKKEYLLKGII